MDAQTITLLVALIGCFVALAGWLANREKKVVNDSEWRGTVNGKLDAILGIDKRVDSLEQEVKEQGKELAAVNEREKSNNHRLDNIEKEMKIK